MKLPQQKNIRNRKLSVSPIIHPISLFSLHFRINDGTCSQDPAIAVPNPVNSHGGGGKGSGAQVQRDRNCERVPDQIQVL